MTRGRTVGQVSLPGASVCWPSAIVRGTWFRAHALPAGERLRPVVAGGGFDAPDLDAGRERLRRGGAAGQQTAAAEADEEEIELADLFDQLQRGRAVAGHDKRVVVGRDHRRAEVGGDALGDGGAIFGVAVVEDDLRAVAAGGGDLGRRARRSA